jgi:hypothetical protein
VLASARGWAVGEGTASGCLSKFSRVTDFEKEALGENGRKVDGFAQSQLGDETLT